MHGPPAPSPPPTPRQPAPLDAWTPPVAPAVAPSLLSPRRPFCGIEIRIDLSLSFSNIFVCREMPAPGDTAGCRDLGINSGIRNGATRASQRGAGHLVLPSLSDKSKTETKCPRILNPWLRNPAKCSKRTSIGCSLSLSMSKEPLSRRGCTSCARWSRDARRQAGPPRASAANPVPSVFQCFPRPKTMMEIIERLRVDPRRR